MPLARHVLKYGAIISPQKHLGINGQRYYYTTMRCFSASGICRKVQFWEKETNKHYEI